ncbi:hypothetical protein BIY29_05195 [Brenneria alni]|uniref:ABC transporter domain-containing protein n=1 Tax=Brenneria alni TaxID=71656 RepID=A0A421DRQ6_9GAMM|nr:ATP-binding cassette domain-containing protein [Brenneria alni]RLM26733.1 hypothetical protein BIY29_05195 [Brenneria alni]
MTALLDIQGLSVHFPAHVAVDNLDLRIAKEEMLAQVGKSGCGKSTTALSIMRLLPMQTKVSGAITLGGKDLLRLGERQLASVRGNGISMIFQEPVTSLNPLLTIGRPSQAWPLC